MYNERWLGSLCLFHTGLDAILRRVVFTSLILSHVLYENFTFMTAATSRPILTTFYQHRRQHRQHFYPDQRQGIHYWHER
jgi:hypothetical protein